MNKLTMFQSVQDVICESFIYETDENLVVMDGGYFCESEKLFQNIKSRGGHVTDWFFSHAHDDHIGAFTKLLEEHGDEIEIDTIYYNFPSDVLLETYEPYPFDDLDMPEFLKKFHNLCKTHAKKVITPKKGDIYKFPQFEIHVLREPNLDITCDYYNNSTVVYRLDTNGKRVMFLGDLGKEAGEELAESVPAEELKSDYVQMAHHGQKGAEKPLYDLINPDYCFWCTPSWLWDNIGKEGHYDSGDFHTIRTRGWMSEIGIKQHFVNKDGDCTIDLGM